MLSSRACVEMFVIPPKNVGADSDINVEHKKG